MAKGYKTYLVAAGAGVVQILHSLGILDAGTYNLLMGLIASAAAATLSSKINRVEAKVEEAREVVSELPNKLVDTPKIVVRSPIDKS